jgi:hypothetical protein
MSEALSHRRPRGDDDDRDVDDVVKENECHRPRDVKQFPKTKERRIGQQVVLSTWKFALTLVLSAAIGGLICAIFQPSPAVSTSSLRPTPPTTKECDCANEEKIPHTTTTTTTPSAREACLERLPKWVRAGDASVMKEEFVIGSKGLTDKTQDGNHKYQHMYHRYLAQSALQSCLEEPVQKKKFRMLEIGLGCHPSGGMIHRTPGGSAFAWRHLFPADSFDLDLHIMEFDKQCATKWAADHPTIAKVHTGDASNATDLDRVWQESGGAPFDFIVDDASHINEHQIKTFEHMITHVAAEGGVYVIEDIHSSCEEWKANTGRVKTGLVVQGTEDCMETKDGKPTIYAKIVEWQKALLRNQFPFPDVTHIDVCFQAAVFSKQV